MSRTVYLTAIALPAAALALVTTLQFALAQAGSTGGTLGKANKSISGDNGAQSQPKTKSPDAAAAVPAAPAIPKGPQTFQDPRVNGVRVDWCMTSTLGGCGEGAATAWCQSKGFSHAINYKWVVAPPTYRQGDRDICSGFCGGFTEVTCQ